MPQPAAPTDARRPLTVLFVDLVGSTPLSIVLGGEAYAELIADYRALANDIIARHGGYVPRDEGDGRYVWFGWPQARRDDAQRAVATAVELHEAVRSLAARVHVATGRRLRMRAGIHTGSVIVRFPRGSELPEIHDPTVNFAAKVQQAADPGAILISEATAAALVAPLDLEPWGTLTIEELSGGIGLFRVAGAQLDLPDDPPFVGRVAELARLSACWQEVAAGGSALVALTGSAGSGKSRLGAELVRLSRPPAVVRAQGDQERINRPFGAFERTLGPVAELMGAGGPEALTDPGDDRAAHLDRLLAGFRAAAARAPMLLVVEDAHTLDPSSADLVDLLCQARLPGLMVLLTARRRPDAEAWPGVEELAVGPITHDEALAMVTLLSPTGDVAADAAGELIARAAGNPFFLVWLSRAGHDDYRGLRKLLSPRSGVPAVVQQAVRSSIDEAGVPDGTTAMAAVIGMEFSPRTLAGALGRPPAAVEGEIRQLVRHDLLQRVGEGRYRFAHHLVRDLAYDLLLDADRRASHARVADTLEAQGSDDHAILGRHCDLAGQALRAAGHLLEAARRCRRTDAYREGAALVGRVAELIDGGLELDPSAVLETRDLAAAFATAVDPDLYVAGTSARSGVLELLDPGTQVRHVVIAQVREWAAAVMTGDMRSSGRLLWQVWRAGRSEMPEILVCNRSARGLHAFYRGRYSRAEQLLCRAAEEMIEDGIDPWLEDNWATPDDPLALAYSFAPPALRQRGRAGQARFYLAEAWRRAETVPGGAHTMAHVGTNMAAYWELAGDGYRARALGEQVAEIGRELGLTAWEVTGQIHARRGQALVEPTPELVQQLEADAALCEMFAAMAAGLGHLLAGASWLRLDEPERALASLDAAARVSATTGLAYLDAEVLRLRAALSAGDERIDCLVRSARLAARQGALVYRMHALRDLAAAAPGYEVDGVAVESIADELGAALAAVEGGEAVPVGRPDQRVGRR